MITNQMFCTLSACSNVSREGAKQRQNKYKPNLHKLNLDNIRVPHAFDGCSKVRETKKYWN